LLHGSDYWNLIKQQKSQTGAVEALLIRAVVGHKKTDHIIKERWQVCTTSYTKLVNIKGIMSSAWRECMKAHLIKDFTIYTKM
jgi:hypothetical protein